MSDHLRFLVTVDAATGEPVKVEQVGEAGDLTPVDMASFVGSLGTGGASPQPQIVVNIYGGGVAGVTATGGATLQSSAPPAPVAICVPPAVTPPPNRPPNKPRKKKG